MPIDDALVEAARGRKVPGAKLRAHTSHRGAFELMLAASDVNAEPARVKLRASATGYAAVLHDGLRDTVILLLPAGPATASGAVVGGVIGRDGKPAAHLELVCNGCTTVTDANGLYRFERLKPSSPDEVIPEDPYYFVEPSTTHRLRAALASIVFDEATAPAAWRFHVTTEQPVVTLDLYLRPLTASLRGLVDVNGATASELLVELVSLSERDLARDASDTPDDEPRTAYAATRTRADGWYEFPLLVPLEAALRVTRDGRRIADPVPVRVGYDDDAVVHVVASIGDLQGSCAASNRICSSCRS